jgi:hypothetical protein
VRSVVRGDGLPDGIAPPALPGCSTPRVYPRRRARRTPATSASEQVDPDATVGHAPCAALSYFDPATRRYHTITPPPIALTVRPSAKANAAPEIVGAQPAPPVERTRPETLGRDIVFIKDAPGTLRPIGSRPYRSPLWWLLQLVPVLGFAGASAWARQQPRLTGDVRCPVHARGPRGAHRDRRRARYARRGDERRARRCRRRPA